MSAALTFEALAALRALLPFAKAGRAGGPDEAAAIAEAEAVLADVPAQLAISDRAAYANAMRRNDLNACIAIEQRYGLFGYDPETVSVGLLAAAAGRDVALAVTAHLQGEVTS